MKKLLVAGTVGAAVCYLFDSQRGKGRRRHLHSFWRESQKATLEAGRRAARALEPLTPVPEQVLKQINAGGGRTTPMIVVRRLLFGAVFAGLVVGALGYLLDPTRGPHRQERLRELWDKAANHAQAIGLKAAAATQEVIGAVVNQAEPGEAKRRKS